MFCRMFCKMFCLFAMYKSYKNFCRHNSYKLLAKDLLLNFLIFLSVILVSTLITLSLMYFKVMRIMRNKITNIICTDMILFFLIPILLYFTSIIFSYLFAQYINSNTYKNLEEKTTEIVNKGIEKKVNKREKREDKYVEDLDEMSNIYNKQCYDLEPIEYQKAISETVVSDNNNEGIPDDITKKIFSSFTYSASS